MIKNTTTICKRLGEIQEQIKLLCEAEVELAQYLTHEEAEELYYEIESLKLQRTDAEMEWAEERADAGDA